ncbi:MAG TPA: superoxide dismutase [Propionibacteriaceae bacterium]
MTKRMPWRLLAAPLLGLALIAPLAGSAQASPTPTGPSRSAHLPERIELPNGFQPEGIAIGPGRFAYFGSRVDGDIYRANLRTGEGTVISQGPGTASIGLKSDRRGRLFVAGGAAGTGRVVSAQTGEILRTYQFTTEDSFVNDVVLTKRTAWFTDSRRAELYGVPLGRNGRPAPASRVIRLPLGGQWVQTAGVNNANGISTTPDRKALLVVQSNTGFLFRVNPTTGRATRVDLGNTLLTNGDGLLRQGRILYAVQNRLNQVAVVKLNRTGTSGQLVDTLKSDDFDVPTTVAAYRGSLYLPNARFTTTATPDTPYWVTRIARY